MGKNLLILKRPSATFISYRFQTRGFLKASNRLIESLAKLNGRKDLVRTSIAGRTKACEAIRTVGVRVLRVEYIRLKQGLRVDFMVTVKYKGIRPKARLKADRYLINAALDRDGLKLSIGFIKGLMRTDPDELASMIIESIAYRLRG